MMKFLLLALSLFLFSCADHSADDRQNGSAPGGDVSDGSDTGGGDTGDGDTGSGSGPLFHVSVNGDDAADGSQAAPWRTIQHAIDQLQPGDSLRIGTGVYSETLLIGAANSGTEGAPITITGEPGAIIDGSGITPEGRHALIELRSAAWVHVEGLELRNFRTRQGYEISDTPVGLLISGVSHDIEVRDLDIHGIENRSSCSLDDGCGTGANGIAVYGDTTTAIRNLRFINNRVHDNVLASSEAFTLNGNIDGFELIGNESYDNNNIGFDFIGYEPDTCPSCDEEMNRVRNGIVRNNRAYRNSSVDNPAYGGDTEGSAGGFYVDGGRNIVFEGNESFENDMGFEFASEHAGKASENLLMVSNRVHHNREVGLAIGGYASSDSGQGGGHAARVYVYNNSFYQNRGWGSEITLAYRVSETRIANNVIQAAATFDELLDQQNNGGYDIEWGNNLWWAEDGGDIGDLPPGQSVGDPQYANPELGDLAPMSGSLVIDAGSPQPGLSGWAGAFWDDYRQGGELPATGTVSKDAAGAPRVVGAAIDLGAIEVQ